MCRRNCLLITAINCGAYMEPVTLVPGRSRLFTSPRPTGSLATSITIGLVWPFSIANETVFEPRGLKRELRSLVHQKA
jgi:hypothetical protein